MRSLILIIIALTGISFLVPDIYIKETNTYLSPGAICSNNTSGKAYVSLSTAGKIAVVNIKKQKLESYVNLDFNPGGIVLSKNKKTLIVADRKSEGSVHLISLKNNKLIKSISTGHTPDALALTPDGELLFVANRFSNTISVINTENFNLVKNIPVEREPKSLTISPDGQKIAVGNNIPASASTDSYISAKISLINRDNLEVEKHIGLANGSQSIEGLAFSKDGKTLFVSHILSRNNLPTSQIEHGWINSNAVSLIDMVKQKYLTSILLDDYNKGAANPGNMALSPDGSKLIILLSGVHKICKIDLLKLQSKLDNTPQNQFENIPYDLRFLYGIKQSIDIKGKSPRNLAFHGNKLLVSSYFSSFLELLPLNQELEENQEISLGEEDEMSIERKGELLFCNADLCFQQWQSCLSCHPGARADGLNWDLLNDGAGNPKNTKSLLYSHFTPPVMVSGIRDKAETAVRSGIKYIQFTQYDESDAQAIDSYLKSLKPIPSPYLINGKLSPKAKKGKEIFDKAGCHDCHSDEYYTDMQKYDVGTGIGVHQNDKFDVPTLSEIWRTAPYLYDGRAKTMKEVLSVFNPDDKHGNTSKLTDVEMDCLIEYVLSL